MSTPAQPFSGTVREADEQHIAAAADSTERAHRGDRDGPLIAGPHATVTTQEQTTASYRAAVLYWESPEGLRHEARLIAEAAARESSQRAADLGAADLAEDERTEARSYPHRPNPHCD